MGCGSSSYIFQVKPGIKGQGEEVMRTAKSLHYTSDDLNMLYTYFMDVDKEKTGSIYISDFAQLNPMETDVIAEILFRLFARSGNIECLNFNEFITACFHIFTINDNVKVRAFSFIV